MPSRKKGTTPTKDSHESTKDSHESKEEEIAGSDNHRSRSRLIELAQQLPMLTPKTWSLFDRALEYLIYSCGWPQGLINRNQDPTVGSWDGVEEDDLEYRAFRRTAFQVLRMRISKELEYLTIGCRPGDVRQLYQRIFTRFCRKTAGGIATMRQLFNNYTQESSGDTVEEFCYRLQEKQNMLHKVLNLVATDSSDIELL